MQMLLRVNQSDSQIGCFLRLRGVHASKKGKKEIEQRAGAAALMRTFANVASMKLTSQY